MFVKFPHELARFLRTFLRCLLNFHGGRCVQLSYEPPSLGAVEFREIHGTFFYALITNIVRALFSDRFAVMVVEVWRWR